MSEKIERMCDFVGKLSTKCNGLNAQMQAVDASLEDISFFIKSYADVIVMPIYRKGFLTAFKVLKPWDGVYEGQILQFTELLRHVADMFDLQDWGKEDCEDE